jgi:hypothetical protein
VGDGARSKVRVDASDRSLTGASGMVAITELCEQLDVVGALEWRGGSDQATGSRALGGRGRWSGWAAAQLGGQDHLVGLDCHRGVVAGQALTPVPGLGSTTAAGLTHRSSFVVL